MQDDALRLYHTDVHLKQEVTLDSDLISIEVEPVDHQEDDVFETGEDNEDDSSTDVHSTVNFNANYGSSFTLVDKLGTLTLPRRLMDEAEGEIDAYEQDLDTNASPNQEKNLFCIENQTTPDRPHEELILSVRLSPKKNKKRKREVGDDEDWSLYWTDLSVTVERVISMKKWQKINHFPGMSEICRKDALARNLNRMLKLFPKDYSIFPKTWILPADWGDLQQYARQKKNRTYILKPDTGCQGKGIWITKTPREIRATENLICQTYISRPFLIDGFKFDLRLYVLVTSIMPLRVFVFKDGLARFTTQPYREPTAANVGNVFMHLTNYAIQKHSESYIREDEETGTKRRITTVNCWLIEHGYDVDKIWRDIDDVILKVLMSGLPVLRHNYRTCFPNHIETPACFEILGFDVMLDRKMRPYVIEVNHSPSFHTDSQLDKEIKEALIWDTLKLANFDAVDRKKCIEEDKRRIRQRLLKRNFGRISREDLNAEIEKWAAKALDYENEHLGNFRRIYPCKTNDVYEKFINSSTTFFTETATFKARVEHSKQLREEMQERKEHLESIFRPRQNRLRPESPSRTPGVNGTRRWGIKPRPGVGGRTQGDSQRPSSHLESGKGGPQQTQQQASKPSQPQTSSSATLSSFEAAPIDETAEQQRCLAMEKRAVLLRSLGVVDAVYRLLAGTPGVDPSAGIPKKGTVGDREATRQLSVAKPVEIVLPQLIDSSVNNLRIDTQIARESKQIGPRLKLVQSNNSRSSMPVRQSVQVNMPRSLPILGRSCMQNRETTVSHEHCSEKTLLEALPPGVALSSLGLHFRDASTTLIGQNVPFGGRGRSVVRSDALSRFNVARSATDTTALARWNKQARRESLVLQGGTLSPRQQALLAVVNGRRSSTSVNDLCLNGDTEGSKYHAMLNITDIPKRCVSTKSNTLYAQIVDNANLTQTTSVSNCRFPPIKGLPSPIPVKLHLLGSKEIPLGSSQSVKLPRKLDLTLNK